MKKAKIVFLALVLLASLAVSACNTMEGLGQDTEAAGQALKKAAGSNKGY